VARAVLQRAALVAVVSDDLKGQLGGLAPEVASLVLRLPVVSEGEPPELPVHPPIQLVAAGRLSPEKGFDVLLEAMQLAVAEGRDLRLDIIGSGPERDRLLELAEPLQDRVRMLPAVPRAELLRRIDEAHVLVAPSRREGLGMVALEALSRGRPVIASRVGGLVETVEHGVDGLLVAPDDPEALAGALTEVEVCRPRAAALDRHETGAVGKAHLEAYRSIKAP
jgi:glycosyltransferase involved in cell wall biosynthesis